MYIYLQQIFSFCEIADPKNKIYAFDTTVVRGCGMYKKLVNLYKMKTIEMFIAKKGGNVMIHEPHLTFHGNNRVDENGCNASLLILPFYLYFVVISLKQIMDFQMRKEMIR